MIVIGASASSFASDIRTAEQACPGITELQKEPSFFEKMKKDMAHTACPELMPACSKGYEFFIPNHMFGDSAVYKIQYKGPSKIRKYQECLLHYDKGMKDYGCKNAYNKGIQLVEMQDRIWIYNYYIFPIGNYDEYPESVHVQVLDDESVVWESNISLSYKTHHIDDYPCAYDACCHGSAE